MSYEPEMYGDHHEGTWVVGDPDGDVFWGPWKNRADCEAWMRETRTVHYAVNLRDFPNWWSG